MFARLCEGRTIRVSQRPLPDSSFRTIFTLFDTRSMFAAQHFFDALRPVVVTMITHNDGSYFHSNAASNSFIGRFEGSAELNNCMSEDAVSDFIQSSRPDLFRELSCLPVPSYDILGDSRAPSSTDHDNLAFDGGKGNTDPVLENEAASSRSKPPLLRTLTAAPFKHQNWSDRESLELQHKRYLLSRLLSESKHCNQGSLANPRQMDTFSFCKMGQDWALNSAHIPCASENNLRPEPSASAFHLLASKILRCLRT